MAKDRQCRRTEFNRANILAAAAVLFERRGLEQTTMDDIAREADYSKSTIYVYFKSKEEIYYHIVLDSMGMLKTRLESAIAAHGDADAAFLAICAEMTAFQREYPLYFDSILGEISVDEGDFERCPVLREIYEVGERINAAIFSMLERGIASGQLRADLKPATALFMLWASICGIVKMARQKERYFEDKLGMKREEYLDDSFRMLLRALKQEECE
jgi:AcrR family transcriptional regulator